MEVGFINRTIKPDILILTETMVNEGNTECIIKSLGQHNHDTIPPHNHTRGIWLLRNLDNVVVTVLAKDARAIHCNVAERSTSKNCILTAVYAPTQNNEKHDFCNDLNHLNNVIHLPWCILGDFNEMLHPSEKIGGTCLCASRLRRLNNFLAHSEWHDANVQGRIFTWKKLL